MLYTYTENTYDYNPKTYKIANKRRIRMRMAKLFLRKFKHSFKMKV